MTAGTTLAVLGTVSVRGHGVTSPGAVLHVRPRHRLDLPGIDGDRIAVSLGDGRDGTIAYLTPEEACKLAGALMNATDEYDR